MPQGPSRDSCFPGKEGLPRGHPRPLRGGEGAEQTGPRTSLVVLLGFSHLQEAHQLCSCGHDPRDGASQAGPALQVPRSRNPSLPSHRPTPGTLAASKQVGVPLNYQQHLGK